MKVELDPLVFGVTGFLVGAQLTDFVLPESQLSLLVALLIGIGLGAFGWWYGIRKNSDKTQTAAEHQPPEKGVKT